MKASDSSLAICTPRTLKGRVCSDIFDVGPTAWTLTCHLQHLRSVPQWGWHGAIYPLPRGMLQNSTVVTAGHLHSLHISYGAAAHGQLLQMQVDCKKAAPVVVGDRASYDLLLPRTPTRFTLQALSAKLTPGPSGRRLLVSAQRSCTSDDARFINFLAQFLQVDVLGACRFHLTYNTRHARELLRKQAGGPGRCVK